MLTAIGVLVVLLGKAVAFPVSGARDPGSVRFAFTPVRQDSACRAEALPSWWGTPTSTLYTTPPELKNREEARAAIAREYPPRLKADGIGGVAQLWLWVDACGQVRETRLRASSGQPALDSAALRLARMLRFAPALRGRVPVSIWIQIPIVFGNGHYVPSEVFRTTDTLGVPEGLRADVLPRFPAPAGSTGPSLVNFSQIEARLTEGYAPLMAQGIAGTTTLVVRLGPDGRVEGTAIARSSGTALLDSLALSVARAMVFTPAVDYAGRYSSVETTVPIRFRNAMN